MVIIHQRIIKTLALAVLLAISIWSCTKEDPPLATTSRASTSALEIELSTLDNGTRAMMQGFYWDVEPKGEWYNKIRTKLEDWKTTGIDRIWLPAPGKGQSGFNSMGYDPADYFDLGEFDQHGTVETRFGSRAELEALIDKAHDLDLEVIADIVIGHNSGGGKQVNPFRNGEEVFSLFNEANGNASGKFNRTNAHFHPNDIHDKDAGQDFFPETDLCHDQPYVREWLWEDETKSVAHFYSKVIGFDGWRFDYVKSFDPNVVKSWNAKTPGLFSVGENFDGNNDVLKTWVEASGSAAFDFACFYKLDEALDRHQDLTLLGSDMLHKTNPDKAVTFVANHDTEKDKNPDNRISAANKLLAYAYILTHDGYPTLFYSDYENSTFKPKLQTLVKIHNSLAKGSIEILEINPTEYIMKRAGEGTNPGLILYMNISNNATQRLINTNWNTKTLVDYARNSKRILTTNADGNVIIHAPAKSFSIWSTTK